MAVTPTQFKDEFPEFATLTDPDVQLFIDQAERRTARTNWGVKADDGVKYLTAHLLTMRARATGTTPGGGGAGVRGPMASETVGSLSRSFSNVTAAPWTNAWLESTAWGSAYAELRSLVFSDRIGAL